MNQAAARLQSIDIMYICVDLEGFFASPYLETEEFEVNASSNGRSRHESVDGPPMHWCFKIRKNRRRKEAHQL